MPNGIGREHFRNPQTTGEQGRQGRLSRAGGPAKQDDGGFLAVLRPPICMSSAKGGKEHKSSSTLMSHATQKSASEASLL